MINKINSLVALVEFNPFKREWCDVLQNLPLKSKEWVIVSDGEGEDMGKVLVVQSAENRITTGTVIRYPTEENFKTRMELEKETPHLLRLFRQLQCEHRLNMEVITAHWRLDGKKICFYFTADSRLNFKKFHKSLAYSLKTKYPNYTSLRVAIKQVGLRDYVRFWGGIGICGRIVCCKQVLPELKPITLRMARQQNLFVEPTKISGLCGKLLCCLSYEESYYQNLIQNTQVKYKI